jgi:hypothetical protein
VENLDDLHAAEMVQSGLTLHIAAEAAVIFVVLAARLEAAPFQIEVHLSEIPF